MNTKQQEHTGNQVVLDALQLKEDLVQMLIENAGHRVGYEIVSTRKVRDIIRGVVDGDAANTIALATLWKAQPDQQGKDSLLHEVVIVCKGPVAELAKKVIQGDDRAMIDLQRLMASLPQDMDKSELDAEIETVLAEYESKARTVEADAMALG